MADSLGNNLLPYDLPDTPVINPDDYRVISDFPSTVFFYRYNRFKEFGYSFTFGEDPYVIRTSSLYQSDSVYKVTVCFSEQCDTVIARVHSMDEQFNAKDVFPCGTKWVVWGNDTIYPKSCAAIPVKIK
ncbi:MAG: hypothetical protein J5I91_09425 [Bacteroidetes bacterium]|nr:hypothetical protein [Bacteroidota bacterium]